MLRLCNVGSSMLTVLVCSAAQAAWMRSSLWQLALCGCQPCRNDLPHSEPAPAFAFCSISLDTMLTMHSGLACLRVQLNPKSCPAVPPTTLCTAMAILQSSPWKPWSPQRHLLEQSCPCWT